MLSLEEFERLPEDGMRHELDSGDLISVTHPKLNHTYIQRAVFVALFDFARRNQLGEVFIEAGCLLSREPPTLRVPDVCFVRDPSSLVRTGYVQGAPDLAVEVVSPDEPASGLMRKVKQYLAAGAHMVWVVYPDLRAVHVHRAGQTIDIVNEDQNLEAGDLLPGFSLRVGELFR